ncbi:galactose-binding domain-like protein [Schizophyllum amplum]|uniref:Galactose-binding domain-like protein n=1 Tax=Schizophyllum amplum TaxID=97359 RepID=A0A550CXC3_9AGAR|nr:galactose-binding domain-like protein [Auriculariopsis ampla]
MAYERVPLDRFSDSFSALTELSSVALGGKIISVSDEFFAEASNLLLVEPAPSLKGQFGPNGALYSGWESRRHNPNYDWCIIRLGTSGTIQGFDVDTTHFNGNEAPEVSIQVLDGSIDQPPSENDSRWVEVLPKVPIGPTSRHLFTIPETTCANYVKLNMIPDGGIARFRVYGKVAPVFPSDPSQLFDLAHVFAGGRVDFISDQHFGVGSNLILPGRGKDMGDGWETKRSRQPGHKDWVIVKLGVPGTLEQVEIDTAHFKGNFPDSVELHALFVDGDKDWTATKGKIEDWAPILPRTKVGPHRQHHFLLENVQGKVYTHVKMTIHPDGGVKRIRLLGYRKGDVPSFTTQPATQEIPAGIVDPLRPVEFDATTTTVPALPLTPEAFAPFGQVIQAYGDHAAAPKGMKITPANAGTASKFHKQALLESSYDASSGATTGLSVYRCDPIQLASDRTLPLQVLERHPYTNQAFIPMGNGNRGGLSEPGVAYLVTVAKNGRDGRPDLTTLRAFVATAAQGIVYNTAVWHQPMTVLDKPMDFTCVETQIGNGDASDCEILELDASGGLYKVQVPKV